MNDFDSFTQLWQQQSPAKIDVDAVLSAYKKARFKQWLYAGFDLLGLFVVPILFLGLFPTLNQYEMIWFAVMGSVAFVFTLYVLWLRRLMLFKTVKQTHHYIQVLQQQNFHQIQLAKCTQWMTYFIGGMFIWFIFGVSDFSNSQTEKLSVLFFIGAILFGIWIWAKNRQALFVRRVANGGIFDSPGNK